MQHSRQQSKSMVRTASTAQHAAQHSAPDTSRHDTGHLRHWHTAVCADHSSALGKHPGSLPDTLCVLLCALAVQAELFTDSLCIPNARSSPSCLQHRQCRCPTLLEGWLACSKLWCRRSLPLPALLLPLVPSTCRQHVNQTTLYFGNSVQDRLHQENSAGLVSASIGVPAVPVSAEVQTPGSTSQRGL